jgi:hypothetical protein
METAYSSFEDLTKAASLFLKKLGRSKQTIEIYSWIWKKVKVYMDANRIINCTSKTIADYLKSTYGTQPISSLSHHQKHCLRCALCLAQFAETNGMIEVIRRREKVQLSGQYPV